MQVFVSYRRNDGALVDRLLDHLRVAFGSVDFFRDVDHIDGGQDLRRRLGHSVRASDLVLVLIGPNWERRVPDRRPDQIDLRFVEDYVQMEVEVALGANVPILPVLLGDTPMPNRAALPPSMWEITALAASRVRSDPDFGGDIELVARRLRDLGIGETSGDAIALLGQSLLAAHSTRELRKVKLQIDHAVMQSPQPSPDLLILQADAEHALPPRRVLSPQMVRRGVPAMTAVILFATIVFGATRIDSAFDDGTVRDDDQVVAGTTSVVGSAITSRTDGSGSPGSTDSDDDGSLPATDATVTRPPTSTLATSVETPPASAVSTTTASPTTTDGSR